MILQDNISNEELVFENLYDIECEAERRLAAYKFKNKRAIIIIVNNEYYIIAEREG